MDKKPIYVLSSLLLIAVLGVFIGYNGGGSSLDKSTDSINYHSLVCVTHTSNGIELSKQCSHNLLTTDGKNLIKTTFGLGGNVGPVSYIALCNSTAGCTVPAIGDTTLINETAICGMGRAAGTYSSNGNGNWSIAKTFTSTCDNVAVNTTGLFNQSATGILFAKNAFTPVTLQTNDQLTINWTIGVS